MKILHVAAYNNLYFNGVFSVLVELTKRQMELGHQVKILNIDNNEGQVLPIEQKVKGQRDFCRFIDDYQPDIAILHGIYKSCYIGFIHTLDHCHIPYLVEPHGGSSLSNSKKNPIKKWIGRLLIGNRLVSHAKAVIYLNQKEADDCIFCKQRQSYVIIPNGVGEMPPKPQAIFREPIRFIFLARIDIDQKALDLLFPAIKQLNASIPKGKAEFHFYGKARIPQYASTFDKYIQDSDDNVYYHGPVFGPDKINAYHSSDVFILISRYEGMPMSVLEALSCGLPCLLTPQTNMADIISRYHCGWITQLDVHAIAESLRKIVEDFPLVADEYSENARQAVVEYSWVNIAKKSISCYASFGNVK